MRLTNLLGTLLALGVFAAILLAPLTACGYKVASPATHCLANLKQLSIGHVLYFQDHDEHLSNRDRWMDEIEPYVKSDSVFHEPMLPEGGSYYAFNAALSNAPIPEKPVKTILVYDSYNPLRNASDPLTSLPRPARHNGKNIVGYVDGHAKKAALP